MASAGTVTVDFAAETAKFTAELKKVQASLNKLEGNFKSVEKVASFALKAFSTGALLAFAKQAFAAADATATAAERAGIAVDSFSRLQYAAGQADVEMGALTTGIQRFQIALSKADDESKEAIGALSRFGLQAESLKNLKIEDQLAEVADAFSKITDPADRTRVAVDLFGKSAGPQLVPLLSQGRAGIATLTKAADDLGITMSATTAAGIDQADAAIKTFLATLQGAAQKSLATLSIAVLGTPNEIVALEKQIESLKEQRDDILYSNEQGVGVGFEIYRDRVNEINALLPQLESRLKSIRDLQAGIAQSSGPGSRRPDVNALGFSEIDLAPIQALKIEIDELSLAYGRLAQATAEVKAQRVAEALDLATNAAAEAQREIEQQITNDLEFQLQARSALQSQYREQQYQDEIAWALARENLERATLGNIMGAMQSFAGQSEKVAIALVAVQKAQALAQAVSLGYVAIAQAAASAPPPLNAPAIFWAKALMAANIAGILASGYGQVRQIRASGGAPIGTPANPAVTAPIADVDQGATSQSAIQVIIANNVGFDQRVMDQIIAGIREAADDRDVIIFGPGSRQAREIVGG